jgi:hypothetical protein
MCFDGGRCSEKQNPHIGKHFMNYALKNKLHIERFQVSHIHNISLGLHAATPYEKNELILWKLSFI